MTQTMQERTDVVPDPVAAAPGQLMGDFAATAGVVLTALGRRLGLWDAMAAGPAPAEVVAERAGSALPYVREWLRSRDAKTSPSSSSPLRRCHTKRMLNI